MKRSHWPILLVALFLLWGCSTTTQKEGPRPTTPKPFYTGTEFPDIVIPKDLSVDQNKSMIVRTKNYVGGVLVAKGRVKARSVEEFFKRQLAARGWDLVGSIYYRNILLAFKRPNGFCMIYISDSFNTEVQIWASESLGDETLQ